MAETEWGMSKRGVKNFFPIFPSLETDLFALGGGHSFLIGTRALQNVKNKDFYDLTNWSCFINQFSLFDFKYETKGDRPCSRENAVHGRKNAFYDHLSDHVLIQ